MRIVLAIGAMIFGSGVAVAAPDPEIAIGPGTAIYWTSAYDGGTENFRETFVAQGEDYQIFRTESDWTEGGPADHFALFSGLYFTTCDTEMPTAEERAQLAGLWPLTTGEKVDLASGDGASFQVGAETEFFLMGNTHPAHFVSGTYGGDEPSEEELVILDQAPLTVAIIWEDGTKDTATLVTRPKSVASTRVDTDLIGTCASLLNTVTNEK